MSTQFGFIGGAVIKEIAPIIDRLKKLGTHEAIATINEIKRMLHAVSPLRQEPVDCVIWVKADTVQANDYNPNTVAVPEMRLLEHSITEDGYTQPVVTWIDGSNREVVDGFHRNKVAKESKKVRERLHGYIPVTTINQTRTERNDRIASTIRHNRARGKHRIDAMSNIVVELKRRNWSDEKIGRELGMDPDEVLRLTQVSGLAEMFATKEFSEAWESDSINEEDNLELDEESQD